MRNTAKPDQTVLLFATGFCPGVAGSGDQTSAGAYGGYGDG